MNTKIEPLCLLIGVDAKGIYEDRDIRLSNDADQPTALSSDQVKKYISICTNPKNQQRVNNTDLRIETDVKDPIIWRGVTFFLGADYHIIIYGCTMTNDQLSIGKTDFIVSSVKFTTLEEDDNDKDNENATSETISQTSEMVTRITTTSTTLNNWVTTFDEPGDFNCALKFAIYNRAKKVQGYYSWNINIHVKNPLRNLQCYLGQ